MIKKPILHSKTFRKLFFSYFLLLFLLVLVLGFLSVSSLSNNYQEDIKARNIEEVKRISYLMEGQLQEIRNIATRIQKLSWVSKYYVGLAAFDQEFDVLRRQEITNEFSLYIGSDTAVQELALFFPERQTVVSASGWSDLSEYLLMRKIEKGDEQKEVLRELYSGNDLTELTRIENKYQNGGCIVIACAVEKILRPRAYACFFINKQWLSQMIEKNMPNNLCSLQVFEQDTGRLILQLGQTLHESSRTFATDMQSGYLNWEYRYVFDDSLNGIPASRVYSQMLMFAGIMLLGFFLSFALAALTYRPIGRLLRRVAAQQQYAASSDYGAIEKAFDHLERENMAMLTNIEELQKIELDYFHLQIRPHFFLNCLNIIYSMAHLGNFLEIQRFVLVISDYLRYLFANNVEPVLIEDEVEHIKKYLEIQEIRHLSPINCSIQLDENARGYLIPPLLLQTFVENAVKSIESSDREDNSLHVSVRVIGEGHENKMFEMKVEDSGGGFSDEILKSLSQSGDIPDENGRRRIGIQNSVLRLRLMYGVNAQVRFSNSKDTGGAVVQVLIPEGQMKKTGKSSGS